MLSQLPPSFFWWIFVPSAATDGSTIAVCNQLLGVEPGPGASCWPPSAARTADRLGMEPGPGWQRMRVSGSFAPAAARDFFGEGQVRVGKCAEECVGAKKKQKTNHEEKRSWKGKS